jgi:hypothetical protein
VLFFVITLFYKKSTKEVCTMKKLKRLVPIIKAGTEADAGGDYISLHNLSAEDPRRKWFSTSSLIVLGVSPKKREGKGGYAEWEFAIPARPEFVEVYLRIITFRTHGGLHTPPKIAEEAISAGQPKEGRLFINGKLVDAIHLMKPMFHGLDYGFNRLDPYPIIPWVRDCQKGKKNLRIKIEVDPSVYWDIDWLKLEPFIGV